MMIEISQKYDFKNEEIKSYVSIGKLLLILCKYCMKLLLISWQILINYIGRKFVYDNRMKL